MSFWERAIAVAADHPRSHDKLISYGTAGFRTKADLLDHVMYRMGLLAVVRSWAKQGQAIGVMITASHNPEGDNGVKLVDPAGEMLEFSWESLATDLANAEDKDIGKQLDTIMNKCGLRQSEICTANVILGQDTRQSSPALAKAVVDAVATVEKASLTNLGVVTTPQLHYLVVATNTKGGYGEASLEGYYSKLSSAFCKFMSLAKQDGYRNYQPKIQFDGANGVGSQSIKQFSKRLEGVLEIGLHNTGDGVLNSGCGADFVKVSQSPAAGLESVNNERCVSVDGDADRVVYFFQKSGVFHLLDGDKIATLIAGYIGELVNQSGLQDKIKLGLVQTAYANGSSTDYIVNKLGVPVACAPTGVKHLHHKALEYDIGVYFEANGHGTVIFSEEAQKLIKETENGTRLQLLVDVINQTVGDAISDMFLVECILAARGWSVEDWSTQYQDLPNKLMKASVRDRTLITTTDAERQVVTPEGLQHSINQAVAKYNKGRSFVRPSGTEDVVRVYSEAATKEEAEALASDVVEIVKQMLA